MEGATPRTSMAASPSPRVPRFASKEDARDWYSRATAARSHVYGLLTSWGDVQSKLLTAVAALGPPTKGPLPRDGAGVGVHLDEDVPVYRLLGVNPDASLNTLRYLFFHTRCGVWVSVRGGVVALFMPFANAQYSNTFGRRVCLTERRLTVAEYAAHKARELHRRPERLLPNPSQWWLNGGIVCNVMPDNVWGEEYLFAIRDMLDETCAAHAVPDCDFFINKRDYPQLRREQGLDAYEAFTGTPRLARETYSTYTPVFSFYTGKDMADIAMPTTDDWAVAVQACLPPGSSDFFATAGCGPLSGVADARAVFRGTATGRGVTPATNARLRLAEFGAANGDIVDAGVTGYNVRDRVVKVDGGGAEEAVVVVDFVKPDDPALPRRVPFVPMREQVDRFRYIVYVDGHCAASRYGTLMHTGRVVLRVESEHADTSGTLWLFRSLRGVRVLPSGEVEGDVAEADHFVVSPCLANLRATVLYLRAHEAECDLVVANARARAPTVPSITAYWLGMLTDISRRQCECSGGAGHLLFDALDPAYARLGASRGGRVYSV